MSMPEQGGRIRIGIVGLGMAGSIMIPSISAHAELELAGAAEPNADLRGRFAADSGCVAVAGIEELVAREDIDAVYIATPHQMHREHATLAARHGKHAIVEKPMALAPGDCDAMIAAAREAGTVLVIGHTHGFDAPVRAIREIIDSGRVGAPRMILAFNYTDFLYRPRRPEELDTEQGGGILFNQAPHQIDMVRRIAASPVRSVVASTGRFDPTRPTEGAMMAMLGFANGVQASVLYSGYDHFDSDELHGWIGEGGQAKTPGQGRTRAGLEAMRAAGRETAMRSEMYGYGGLMWQHVKSAAAPSGHPHFGTMIVSCEKGDLRHTPDGVMIYGDGAAELAPLPAPRPGGGRSEVLDELCDAVLRGRPPAHDGAFGKATLEACLAIKRSASEGRQVFLD